MADTQATAGQTVPGTTTGGVTQPASPGTAPPAGQPATTGTAATTGAGADDGVPDRAMVKMTKADLQNAPEFRYSATDAGRIGGTGSTTPPPASTNRPGNAPQQ